MYHQSYLSETDEKVTRLGDLVLIIEILRKLKGKDLECSETGDKCPTREYLYIEFLTDALEKLGFVFYARDQLKKNRKNIAVSKYLVYNLIFDCRAFIDTMAGLLNHHYEMGKKGTAINLCHQDFVKELNYKNPELVTNLKQFENWIKNLNQWRNKLVHRQGLFIPFTKSGAEFMLEDVWNFSDLTSALANKKPLAHIKITEFCEGISKFALLLMELICATIRNDLAERVSEIT